MIQRGQDFGFALKTSEPIVVSRERRRQDLDGDLALQLRVGRAKDLPHAPFANWRRDFVDAETGAGSEGQVADYRGGIAGRMRLVPDGSVFIERTAAVCEFHVLAPTATVQGSECRSPSRTTRRN